MDHTPTPWHVGAVHAQFVCSHETAQMTAITRFETIHGSRKVISTWNVDGEIWTSCLYVDGDETITGIMGRHATLKGVQKWALRTAMTIDTEKSLCTEYAAWNKANGLSLGSADDHYYDESLTEAQRQWLRKFGARWDAWAESEREAS